MKKAIFIFAALMIAPSVYGQSGSMFIDGVLTESDVTDSTITFDVDSLALRNSMLQRLLDSTINANLSSGDGRAEQVVTGFANFSNQTNDSTNFQLDGNVFDLRALPFDMYVDRVVLHFNYGATYRARGPTTFNNLPIISADSTLLFRVRRESATSKYWFGCFKVARANGMGVSKSSGVIVGMIEIDGTGSPAYFPPAGTSVQIYMTAVLTKGKPY